MNDSREGSGPYWLRTVAPFGMTPEPSGFAGHAAVGVSVAAPSALGTMGSVEAADPTRATAVVPARADALSFGWKRARMDGVDGALWRKSRNSRAASAARRSIQSIAPRREPGKVGSFDPANPARSAAMVPAFAADTADPTCAAAFVFDPVGDRRLGS
jgi:hypothetical protein